MEKQALFGGKYIIKELLGGGSSKVFLAENVKLGTLWAVKEIRKSVRDMCVEPEILKRLDHPSLPKIFDVVEESDSIYIIMEYIKGISLDKLLAEQGRVEENTVVKWSLTICDVLRYLHEMEPSPIIHRDLKPSNIILAHSGELRIIDFGTAREFKQDNSLDTVYIGTRGYAAPEQYGGGQTSPASDIYSLGVTMHHLLTGLSPNTPPYRLIPVRECAPEVSEELEEIINKCTKSDPIERYISAAALKEDLLHRLKAANIGAKAIKNKQEQVQMNARFNNRLITVWGNSEFACELAYAASRLSKLKVLIADLDLLSPSVDIYFNVRKYPWNIKGSGLFSNTGLNIVLESAEKKVLEGEVIEKASVRRRELSNLYILTGCYNLEDYEYYSNESLLSFFECAVRSFDLVILCANRSIYDSFTILSLDRSDINIIAVKPTVRELRDFNRWIEHLNKKQKICTDKYKYVIYQWKPEISWQLEFAQRVLGACLMGLVRESTRRERYRSLKAAYVQKMERKIVSDYLKILICLGVVPKNNIFEEIIHKLSYMIPSKKSASKAYPFYNLMKYNRG
ncbi:MAG: serine/threonine-protein kinase [Eubacteriales bacterium]|nr:serine/threonine-protein kinase [Eubacteriales bacterium]